MTARWHVIHATAMAFAMSILATGSFFIVDYFLVRAVQFLLGFGG